uniref:Putative ovule protein n=1 Tax=Solanum chacoense TaxID=4108 RepID=A0A0V0I7V5_SOLCH
MSSPTRCCKSDDSIHMIKAEAAAAVVVKTTASGGVTTTTTTLDNCVKGHERNKSGIPKLINSKSIGGSFEEDVTQSEKNDQVDWKIISRRKVLFETSPSVKGSFTGRNHHHQLVFSIKLHEK